MEILCGELQCMMQNAMVNDLFALVTDDARC